jgi:hypothetical protein
MHGLYQKLQYLGFEEFGSTVLAHYFPLQRLLSLHVLLRGLSYMCFLDQWQQIALY